MALRTDTGEGLILPKKWEASEQETINEFFEERVPAALQGKAVRVSGHTRHDCSASECVQYAKALMQEMPLALVNHQGNNSYTLICPERDRVIQFRATELNIKAIDEAKQKYGDLVASTTYHDDFALPVPRGAFPLERERRTVIDLAKFIATASHFPHPKARYQENSWTLSVHAAIQRMERNESLRQIAPAIYKEMVSLGSKLHLLETLPAVLTHLELAGQNIFVDKDSGNLTGVIDFEDARTEAFGINIFMLYENHFGSMEDGHWTPFDMPAGEQYPGLSVSEVLTKSFWDSLWANIAPGLKREDLEEAVGLALRVGIINRYFVRGMLDEIDLAKRVHVISLDYARDFLLCLRDTGV